MALLLRVIDLHACLPANAVARFRDARGRRTPGLGRSFNATATAGSFFHPAVPLPGRTWQGKFWVPSGDYGVMAT